MTKWLDPEPVDSSPLESLGLPPLVAETLVRRGFTDREAAGGFLEGHFSSSARLHDLPGLSWAVERLASAIRMREPICVWGDFDVDGQTSTTILVQTLRSLGADVTYHIPVRAQESHGVNIANLNPIINMGAKLILTCDTGISAFEEVEYARSQGVDFIITDHHDLPDRLPQATAIVDPKFLSTDHPMADLPGAGVAYELSEALLETGGAIINNDDKRLLDPASLLDLAALGIISDLALLRGDTRALAQKGIERLRHTDRLGLKTIAQLARLDLSQATEESIGFNIGPRLNALGRLGDANPSVELLLTVDPARARLLAVQIEGLNSQRKLLTNQVYQAAEALLHKDPELLAQSIILLMQPSWPGGVIGIVASRLVERYHKAAILLTSSADGTLHGSARSVEGLHITEAIAANKKYLLGYGGHPMAAGLSLSADNLREFHKEMNKTVERLAGPGIREEPALQIDAWEDLSSLSLDLADGLEKMAPFGPGNPSLVFASHGLTLMSKIALGPGAEHIKIKIADDQRSTQEVIWWNGGNEDLPEDLISDGARFDLAYRLRANTFAGKRQLSLEFVDYRVTDQKPIIVAKTRSVIRDYRGQSTIPSLPDSTLFWAEGDGKSKGKTRFELTQCDQFAIWTTPPSPSELHAALETVRPRVIYLFAINPGRESAEEFLLRLAGMTKFAINQRSGKISVLELAAITAHRETTIKFGLEWLATSGHFVMEGDGDETHIATGNGMTNPALRKEFFSGVKGLLEETAAYRLHFASAEPESLINI